jgi:hypothetical protein
MSITLNFDIAKDSVIQGLNEEHIGPIFLTVDKGDDFVRKRVTVNANEWKTLDAGDVGTPWAWVVINVGDNNVEVGFGQGQTMVLEPSGLPAIWTGSTVPYAKGESASSEVLYVAIMVT